MPAVPAAPDRPERDTRPLAARWAQIVVGFAGWGLAASLMVRAGLGLGPWDALHVGIDAHTGIGVGVASILAGLVVLVGSFPFGIRPSLGTVANMVLIGTFIDLFLPLIPPAGGGLAGVAYFASAILVAGWFTGMYVGAGLGSGPRDGLVIALAARSGGSVRRVRTLVELSVLGIGWALGGPLGPGTLIFALAMGPSMQWGLRRWGVIAARPPAPSAAPVAPLRSAA